MTKSKPKNTKSIIKRRKTEGLIPPDGQYGWIIVISYAIANFIGIPTTSNIGLIFKDKFDQLQLPAADLTLILNVNSTLSMAIGLINGPLLRHFGYRKISIIAAVLFAGGLALTAVSNSIFSILLAYSVITAFGYGLSNSSFALALNSFFRNRLNKASGIAMTLAGIGPIIYPPLINWLIHLYGVNGCMLIIGAIALHMLVAAVLLQPLKWHLVKDKSNILPMQQTLSFPHILPNVSTFLSIGKFSESSFVPNSGPRLPFASTDTGFDRKSSHFQLSHDIDTLSIYGFDQIIHRQTSHNKLDQAMIARNFSKRTLNTVPQHEELNLAHRNAELNDPTSQNGQPKLRWFESGSVGSINLGSSLEIFREPIQPIAQPRRLTIFKPWKKQSQLIINALRLKTRRPSNEFASQEMDAKSKAGEKNDSSVPEEQNKMLESNELASGDVERPSIVQEQDQESKVSSSCCTSACSWLVKFFDLDLLRDNIYLNIMVGMAISIFAETNFAILTPFILSDLNFSADEIAIILFAMAIADLMSRFCSPFIADRLNLSIRVSYLVSLVLLVLTRTSMTLINGYTSMLIVCSALGVAKGIRSVYMCIVIPSYIPLERLASASAIQLFGNGVVMMCIGPILGLIKDVSGSYVGCVHFLNACTCITILMYSIELTYTRFRSQKCDKPNNS